eukprot:gene5081-8681_t
MNQEKSGVKRKQNFESNEEKNKKVSKKEKKELVKERKMKTKPNFLVIDEAKKHWEIFKKENSQINETKGRSKIKNEKIDENEKKKNEKRKNELLDKILSNLKGKIEEVSKNQDASRIIQTILKYGNEKHHLEIYKELKGKVVSLSSDIYGHFIIKRLLFYGKKIRKEIFSEFKGQVSKMIQERFPADVIDYAYSEIGNSNERYDIIKEFYGKEFILGLNDKENNDEKFKSLKQVLEKYPGKRESVLKNLTKSVKKSINKNLFNLHIIQKILVDCFETCNLGDVYDLILDLQDEIPHFIHTKEGVLISIYSISFGTTSNRKKILKSFKNLIFETSKNSYGYLFLVKCLSVIDDTILLDNIILKELKQNLLEISLNPISSKIILNLLNPLKYLTKQHQDFLKKPRDSIEETKKGEDKINEELLQKFKSTLLNFINQSDNFNELIKSESGSLILFEIFKKFKNEINFDLVFNFIKNNDLKEFNYFSRQLSKFILEIEEENDSFLNDLFKSLNLLNFINNQNGGFIISAFAKKSNFRNQILKNIKMDKIKNKEDSGNKLLFKILNDPK